MNQNSKTAFSKEQFSTLYPNGVGTHYWYSARNMIIADTLLKLSPKGVLEVGAGAGTVSSYLKKRNFSIWCVEPAPVYPPPDLKNVFFAGMKTSDLPIEVREKIDTALVLDVLEHVPEPQKLISEIEKSLPNLRNIVITVPARQELWNNFDEFNGHFLRYDRRRVTQTFQELGWKPLSCAYCFHILYWPALLFAKLGLKRSVVVATPIGFSTVLHRLMAKLFYLDKKIFPSAMVGSSIISVFNKSSETQPAPTITNRWKIKLPYGSIIRKLPKIELASADGKHFLIKNNIFYRIGFSVLGIPHLSWRSRSRIIMKEMRSVPLSAKILDAGCGYGIYSLMLGEIGFTVDAVDVDPIRIEELTSSLKSLKKAHAHVTPAVASLTKLHFADDAYDLVICPEVIEHIADDMAALGELARVTKPGGKLILTVPHWSPFNLSFYKKFEHERPGYHYDELAKTLKGLGLEPEKVFFYEYDFGTKIFIFYNSLNSKILMGLAFYPCFLLQRLDNILKRGTPNYLAVVAVKRQ